MRENKMRQVTKTVFFSIATGGIALLLWLGMFIFADFTTTVTAGPEELQRVLEEAPRGPMSEQEMERRAEEARRLMQDEISRDKERTKGDPFVHVRSKSAIWTWFPWFLCVLLIGFRGVTGYLLVLAPCVVLLVLRLISPEALLITAVLILLAKGMRVLATTSLGMKKA